MTNRRYCVYRYYYYYGSPSARSDGAAGASW
jgi:hypothetical protein